MAAELALVFIAGFFIGAFSALWLHAEGFIIHRSDGDDPHR